MLLPFWSFSFASIIWAWEINPKRDFETGTRPDIRHSNPLSEHIPNFYHTETNNSNTEELKSYFNFLSRLSASMIYNIHNNIIHNYGLHEVEAKTIDSNFNATRTEYQIILNEYFGRMARNVKYNDSTIFLLDFTDLSNFLLQSVIESNLAELKGKFLLPNFCYNQPSKYTILRQQMKIAINVMEVEICTNLSICIGNSVYTEFIVECLRYLLDASDERIKSFFVGLSDVLYDFMHTIKTTDRFRKKIETFAQKSPANHKDAVDFIDEALTGQDTDIFQSKYTMLVNTIRQFAKVIDDNYDLTEENVRILDGLSTKLYGINDDFDIKNVLDDLVRNLELNVKIWPLEAQNKLDYWWLQVVQLASRI
ncbi:unnamed protein product [Leptosia nina]|uniref:Uncharacterized protein n=1 Tax=Leptosia nina TaxID=320188 RepID=A0AAV1JXA0_9NEOP